MIKFIRYFRYFLLCFDRPISNVAGLSLLFKILMYACSVHFKTHSSNEMSTIPVGESHRTQAHVLSVHLVHVHIILRYYFFNRFEFKII